MSRQNLSRFIILFLLSLGLLLASCDTPPANTIVVGCDVQDLIQAINTANQNPDHTEIQLGYCQYTLTQAHNSDVVDGIPVHNGLPAITTEITIRGISGAMIDIQKDPGEPDFGHFYLTSIGKLNIYDLLLTEGVRTIGGAVINDGGDFFASHVNFWRNTASASDPGVRALGGAIYSKNGRIRLIDGCHFQENFTVNNANPGSNHGGAIYSRNGGLLLSNSSFLWNDADGDGGAVYVKKAPSNDNGAAIQISDTQFRDGSADHNGGAIAILGDFDAVLIATSYFEQNQAGNYGGAIYSEGSGVVADYTDFRANTAAYGGAIYTRRISEGDSSSFESEHADYDFNSASGSGGAIFSENADLDLNEDQFADNSAASCGAIRTGGSPDLIVETGGLGSTTYITSESEVTLSYFDRNLATTSHGGAICHFMGEISLGDTVFSQNEAHLFGGAALLMDDAEVIGTAFLTNSAENGAGLMIGFPLLDHNSSGSSISYLNFTTSVEESWFSTNRADVHGGGIYAHHNGLVKVENTSLVGNSAFNNGGGIYQREGDLNIQNSTISGNSAFRGAGLYTAGEGSPIPQLDLNHVTVAHNYATDSSSSSRAGGGGLNINGNVTSENSLVVDNLPDDCSSGPNLSINLSQNVDSDQSCGFWHTDPLPLLGPVNGIVHPILTGSPLIDLLPVCGLPEDQLGTSRPQGAGCEPGSYEYDPDNPMDIPTMPSMPSSSDCDPFAETEHRVVMLNVAPGSTDLTLYLNVVGGVEAALPAVQAGEVNEIITAELGNTEARLCNMQGFEDRIYCMFTLPVNSLGTTLDLRFFLPDCDDPVLLLPAVSIPVPNPVCKVSLGKEDCKAAGGSYQQVGRAGTYECSCP